jgi:hypothetical protein
MMITRRPGPRGRHVALALTLTLILFACVMQLGGGNDAPPQGWWAARGPVVPHDDFPTDCSLCHTGDDWHTIREDFAFDHEAETGTDLHGAHAQAECLRCHNDRGPVGVFARRGCGGCHEDPHRGELGGDCATCHAEDDWRPDEQIAMHDRTRFPLVGAHAATACWRCHPGARVGLFTRVDTECVTCHAADLARANTPDHLALGYLDSCDRCHISTTWRGAGFTHPGFALTGAHQFLDCDACHGGGIYAGTPSDCYACHATDYAGASDPDHVAGGFPTSCEQCHSTRSWDDAVFDHGGITANCYSCHAEDYAGASDPDHVAGGFPTSCEQCHNTHSWDDADFDHGGITANCADCHLDDYDATTDPNHVAAGFPPVCELCHDSSDWRNATFDHGFPIEQGDHGGFDCTDCHLSPGTFATFSCTHCHEHRQSDMDDEHDDVSGYLWESGACYSCHPDGRE